MRAVLVLSVLASACASPQLVMRASHTPDYAAPASVAIFGVLRDGRMSPAAWSLLTTRLRLPTGCTLGYDEAFIGMQPDISAAIDTYTDENAVGDELLTAIAPAVQAPAILVFSMYGHTPIVIGHKRSSRGGSRGGGGGSRGGGSRGGGSRGGGGGGGRAGKAQVGETDVEAITDGAEYVLEASLYSRASKHTIATVQLTYRGSKSDEALTAFAAKVGATMPINACTPWDWSTVSAATVPKP